ncbi:hypothetical protein [Nitrospirillum pindoramense]|nr:hypothetical protein [Nitrospirillum amazonense]
MKLLAATVFAMGMMLTAAVQADVALPPMANPQGSPEMFGTWTVTKVLCSQCKGRQPAEVGTEIILSGTAFTDPFSTTCASDVAYPNRALSSPEAVKLFKLPKGAQKLLPAGGTVIDTRLNCGGGPYARVLFLGDDKAIYLFESVDFLIERKAH